MTSRLYVGDEFPIPTFPRKYEFSVVVAAIAPTYSGCVEVAAILVPSKYKRAFVE